MQYDPNLTARILHVCNTPAYRPRNGVSSIHEAIRRLGADTINRIVWQLSVAGSMSGALSSYSMEAGTLWRHSVTTAIAAEELWKLEIFQEDIAAVYTAALLHDLGKILTNVAIAPSNTSFSQLVDEEGMLAHHAESALLGFDHAEVGGRLLLKWGQGESLISAVVHHHNPQRAINVRLATLVCAANQCAHLCENEMRNNSCTLEASKIPEAFQALKIKESAFKTLMHAIQKRRDEVEALMAFV